MLFARKILVFNSFSLYYVFITLSFIKSWTNAVVVVIVVVVVVQVITIHIPNVVVVIRRPKLQNEAENTAPVLIVFPYIIYL